MIGPCWVQHPLPSEFHAPSSYPNFTCCKKLLLVPWACLSHVSRLFFVLCSLPTICFFVFVSCDLQLSHFCLSSGSFCSEKLFWYAKPGSYAPKGSPLHPHSSSYQTGVTSYLSPVLDSRRRATCVLSPWHSCWCLRGLYCRISDVRRRNQEW